MAKKTLKEIATDVGVSASMVSLVLHNRAGVGKENRRRITQALSANGYKIYTDFKNGEAGNICFLKFSSHAMLVNGNPGFVNAITDSIEKEASSRGYSLVMIIMDEHNISGVLANLAESNPAGVILLGTELDSRYMQLIESIQLPCVIVDNQWNLKSAHVSQWIIWMQFMKRFDISFNLDIQGSDIWQIPSRAGIVLAGAARLNAQCGC